MTDGNIQVLKMTSSHLQAVAALETLCFSQPWSERSLALLIGEHATGYVVTVGNAVVAYGGMMFALDEGQITNIAVHPEHRRAGYGRKVLDALLSEAVSRKMAQIALEVRVSNHAAIALYEHAGFSVVGKRKAFYSFPAEDALVMLKVF